MPLFVWTCDICGATTRRILPKRPVLSSCEDSIPVEYFNEAGKFFVDEPCGGQLSFTTNTASQTMEVIDNGLMARRLERPSNVEEKMAERKALSQKEDDQIV